ncbi:MAG: DUF1206 domain-containing protein [Bacteroidetes bacterium]|nr:DUF1206 domain-containing protein [Bacteroidota bacterium]
MANSLPTTSPRDKWIELAAKVGLSALGLVYLLIGTLTFMATIELRRDTDEGKVTQILQWIQSLPFGQVMLAITTVGLLCYTLWRFTAAILDTEKKGNSLHGLAIRISYISYGTVYGALTYYATILLFGEGRVPPEGEENTRRTIVQSLLEQPFGQWLVGAFSLGTIAIGVFQIYLALSGQYRQVIQESFLDSRVKEIMIKSGQVGYMARGIVWLVVGYFLWEAAIQSDPSEAGDIDSALNFLEYEYGPLILGIIALGLVCYGIFMFVRARYQPIIKKA